MRDSANFGPGQTVVDRARWGRHKPCDVQSEEGESFTTPKSREERPTIVDHIVFEDGLHRLDECRSLPPVLCRPKEVGRSGRRAHRGLGRASLTRCSMKHGEGFVDSPSGQKARIEHACQRSKVNPVGGAPSRSGFLATPINASSSRTFSI
jgi:hypothetical protein